MLSNLTIIFIFFTNIYDSFELIWIPSLLLVSMIIFRNGAAEAHYLVELKKSLTREDQEVSSSVYNLALLTGLALGNFLALGLGNLHGE